MIAVNEFTDQKCHNRSILRAFIILMAPYAPHFCEELWEKIGEAPGSLFSASYPLFESSFLVEDSYDYPVSFNGKIRFRLKLSLELSIDQIKEQVMNEERTISQLRGGSPKKIIVVQGKIINIVT